jgi:hypothetical protein
MEKKKKKPKQTVGTFPKSNWKIVNKVWCDNFTIILHCENGIV